MAPLIAAAIPSILKAVPGLLRIFGKDKSSKTVEKVLSIGKEVLGVKDDQDVLDIIETDPEQARLFQEAVMNDKYVLDRMHLADKADARGMQKAALAQDDLFSKRFIYYLAIFWSIVAALYIGAVSFVPINPINAPIINTILGFLLGTVVAGIIGFFFGSSKGSQDKTQDSKLLMTMLEDNINKSDQLDN